MSSTSAHLLRRIQPQIENQELMICILVLREMSRVSLAEHRREERGVRPCWTPHRPGNRCQAGRLAQELARTIRTIRDIGNRAAFCELCEGVRRLEGNSG